MTWTVDRASHFKEKVNELRADVLTQEQVQKVVDEYVSPLTQTHHPKSFKLTQLLTLLLGSFTSTMRSYRP